MLEVAPVTVKENARVDARVTVRLHVLHNVLIPVASLAEGAEALVEKLVSITAKIDVKEVVSAIVLAPAKMGVN